VTFGYNRDYLAHILSNWVNPVCQSRRHAR
jgi:hypothetical protein